MNKIYKGITNVTIILSLIKILLDSRLVDKKNQIFFYDFFKRVTKDHLEYIC